jgi:hypothetical protein
MTELTSKDLLSYIDIEGTQAWITPRLYKFLQQEAREGRPVLCQEIERVKLGSYTQDQILGIFGPAGPRGTPQVVYKGDKYLAGTGAPPAKRRREVRRAQEHQASASVVERDVSASVKAEPQRLAKVNHRVELMEGKVQSVRLEPTPGPPQPPPQGQQSLVQRVRQQARDREAKASQSWVRDRVAAVQAQNEKLRWDKTAELARQAGAPLKLSQHEKESHRGDRYANPALTRLVEVAHDPSHPLYRTLGVHARSQRRFLRSEPLRELHQQRSALSLRERLQARLAYRRCQEEGEEEEEADVVVEEEVVSALTLKQIEQASRARQESSHPLPIHMRTPCPTSSDSTPPTQAQKPDTHKTSPPLTSHTCSSEIEPRQKHDLQTVPVMVYLQEVVPPQRLEEVYRLVQMIIQGDRRVREGLYQIDTLLQNRRQRRAVRSLVTVRAPPDRSPEAVAKRQSRP